MSTFLEYVQSLRSSLGKLGTTSVLNLTVGNESCDMDSVVSSLAHAFSMFPTLEENALSLPLLLCNRGDIHSRQDIVWLFQELGIDPDALIYQDDLPADRLSSIDDLAVTLVDRNSTKGVHLLEVLKPKIIRVIDHHERSEDSVSGSGVDVQIESVGSCSTLVAEKFLEGGAQAVDEKLATLFLASILLDTGDLKLQGQVTEKDSVVAEQLLSRLVTSIDRAQFYPKLVKKRCDIAELTTFAVLKKDFKVVQVGGAYTIGFCTITSLLSEFLERPNMFSDLASFFDSNKLDALLLLGICLPGVTDMRKQIAIFRPSSAATSPVPHLLESLASVLEDDPDLKCDRSLEKIEGFDGILLEQGDVSIVRKQIVSKVTKFVESVETEQMWGHTESSGSAAVIECEHAGPLEPTVTVLTKEGVNVPIGGAQVQYSTEETPKIPEYSYKQESDDLRKHRLVQVGEEQMNIDMDLVQPYRKIIQHAGYIGPKRQALVVLSACYLPPHSVPNYSQVIEHLFFYVMSVLAKLVTDEYIIVFLHSGAPHNSMPSIRVFHKFYKMVDRRLRKQLMHLYIVHPTFWVKTMIRLARPIISRKFWRKVHFIATLQELSSFISVDDDFIPAPVLAVDQVIMSRHPASRRYLSKSEVVPEKSAAEPQQ